MIKFFIPCLLLFSACENAVTTTSIPDNVSQITFSSGISMVANATGGNIELNIVGDTIQGTATFSRTDSSSSQPSAINCNLVLTFSSQQISELNTKIKALKYCSKSSSACASENAPSVIIISPSGSLTLDRYWHCSTKPYLCGSADDFFLYLKTIIAANSSVSDCPSDWSSTVE